MASHDSKERASSAGTPSGSHAAGFSSSAHDDNSDELRLRERLEKLLPDVVRRAINAGTTAFSSGEDGIRRLVSEFNLPRDVAAYLIMQASASKDEVLRIFQPPAHFYAQSEPDVLDQVLNNIDQQTQDQTRKITFADLL